MDASFVNDSVAKESGADAVPSSPPRSTRKKGRTASGNMAPTDMDVASPLAGKRIDSTLSLQSPYGQQPQGNIAPPVAVERRPSLTASIASAAAAPSLAPRPTLFNAITRLKISQLRSLFSLSCSPNGGGGGGEFARTGVDEQGRRVGDMLWRAVRENGLEHPNLRAVIECLVKNKVDISFSPFTSEAAEGLLSPTPTAAKSSLRRPASELALDELVYLDVKNSLLRVLCECMDRLAEEEGAMQESMSSTLEELDGAILSQGRMVSSLSRELKKKQAAQATDAQRIALAEVKLESLEKELRSLREQEANARQEVLLLQGKVVYRSSVASEIRFEEEMLQLHEAEVQASVRGREVSDMAARVEEHRRVAVEAKKALRAAEAERTLAEKHAAAEMQSSRDAEARRLASASRAATTPALLMAAAEERHRNMSVVLSLCARNLEKRMLLMKPNPFLKVFRRCKTVVAPVAVPGMESSSAASSSSSPSGAVGGGGGLAPNGTASAPAAAVAAALAIAGPGSGTDVWEWDPCAQSVVLRGTADPEWPPLSLPSLAELIGGDRSSPFKIEVWTCLQVERVLGREGGPNPGDQPLPLLARGIVPPSGVDVELLGVGVCTLAQLEAAARAQGKSAAVPGPDPASPLILAGPLSVQFNPCSVEVPLTHPKKGSKKVGSIFVQSITMEEL